MSVKPAVVTITSNPPPPLTTTIKGHRRQSHIIMRIRHQTMAQLTAQYNASPDTSFNQTIVPLLIIRSLKTTPIV